MRGSGRRGNESVAGADATWPAMRRPAWSAKRRLRARCLLLDDGEEVFFAHHEQFVAVDLDGLAAVLAEQHAIADLDVQDDEVALVIALARAHGQDFALIRLLGGGVGDDDARGGLGFLFQALDDNTVVQRTKLHFISFNAFAVRLAAGSLISERQLAKFRQVLRRPTPPS